MKNKDYVDSPYYLGNQDCPPTVVTVQTGNATIRQELPWDVGSDDLIQAFYTAMIGMTFTPKGAVEAMYEWSKDHLQCLEPDMFDENGNEI